MGHENKKAYLAERCLTKKQEVARGAKFDNQQEGPSPTLLHSSLSVCC